MNSMSSPFAARWSDPPTSATSSCTDPGSASEQESWGERIYAALPLFIVGGACIVVSLQFYMAGADASFGGNSSVALRLWVLFAALGVTGVCAGTVALFAKESLVEPVETEEAVAAPSPPPDWDESSIDPDPMALGRRRTWETDERWLTAASSEVSASDGVLDQIDDIEQSLRKKSASSPPK